MKNVCKKLFSLLLVTALLVSMVPAVFADHDSTHTMGEWTDNGNGTHSRACTEDGCTEDGCAEVETNAHTLDANGKCTTCSYQCAHTKLKMEGKVAATCKDDGKENDTLCADCGKKMANGAAVKADPALHTDANGDNKCDVCNGIIAVGAAHKLTLDANGGKVNDGSSLVVDVKTGEGIKTLPDPVREGYTFAGWFIGDTRIYLNSVYTADADATATAKWTEVTYQLTVVRVLNGDNKTAKTIYTAQVSKDEPLLNYLNANVKDTVIAEKNVTPGYSWENNYWKDYSGSQPLTSQSDKMNQAQTVFVNFKANTYKLCFNANGGEFTGTQPKAFDAATKTMPVTFDKAVGTLPTPTKSGSVFQGWKDESGVIYTSTTVYKVPGDTTLTAVWSDEALVLLRIYINGNFANPDRIVVMDGYVKNNNVTLSDVETVVKKYYSGSGMSAVGLFTDATWASYKADTTKKGTPTVAIDQDHVNNVYVMVKNAKQGGSGNSGTSGTGTANDNPKTGDQAFLGTAATLMVLTAVGFVSLQMTKKKFSR